MCPLPKNDEVRAMNDERKAKQARFYFIVPRSAFRVFFSRSSRAHPSGAIQVRTPSLGSA
jgi:hypothetical protein